MYTSFYNLKAKPFQISSDPAFIWLGEKHKEALATLTYGVLDNKGFMLLTGDVGTGKTTLINTLIKGLSDDILYASVPDPRLGLNDFLNYIASAFNIHRTFKTKGKFLIYFSEFLVRAHENEKKVLLLIDEAQLLTQNMLEEIRLLSNIQKDGNNLLNIFFVGQDEFNEILDRSENRAVAQRLTLNYHLQPLTELETASYIKHRLSVAGTAEQLFDADAIREIQAYSGGFPRRINILCDHCLLTGFVKEQKMVDAEIVRACAHDLKIPQYTGRRTPPSRPIYQQPESAPASVAAPISAPVQPTISIPVQPVAVSPAPTRPIPGRRPSGFRHLLTAFLLLAAGVALLFYFDRATFDKIYDEAGQYLFSMQDKLNTPPLHPTAAEVVPQPSGSTSAAEGQREAEKIRKPSPAPVADASNQATSTMQSAADAVVAGEGMTGAPAKPAKMKMSEETPAPAASSSELPQSVQTSGPGLSQPVRELPQQTVVVRFDNDSSEFYFADIKNIDDFVGALKQHPNAVVVISGHTDNLGSEGYNYRLSLFRANMIKSFFLGKGIPSHQLKVRGFGGEKPLMSNDTPEGRRMNRRVEVDIVQ